MPLRRPRSLLAAAPRSLPWRRPDLSRDRACLTGRPPRQRPRSAQCAAVRTPSRPARPDQSVKQWRDDAGNLWSFSTGFFGHFTQILTNCYEFWPQMFNFCKCPSTLGRNKRFSQPFLFWQGTVGLCATDCKMPRDTRLGSLWIGMARFLGYLKYASKNWVSYIKFGPLWIAGHQFEE